MAMSLNPKKNADGTESYDAQQVDVLEQLPSSLYVALSKFDIDGKTVQYAVCPSCHHTHAPHNPKAAALVYPSKCVNRVVDKSGAHTCGTELLVLRDGRMRPIKPFLCPSFMDHLAQVLSDPEIERLCDQACDDAFTSLNKPPPEHTTNVFEAAFLRDFEGPIPGQHFVDRGDGKRMRLAYAIFLDFFNPNGLRKRGNHDSVGLLSAVNLALPLSLQHKPGYTYVCLIGGPKEPSVEQINGYLRVIVDEALIAWERGIHLSSTGTSPEHGRDVDLAFVLSINDLPAARKFAGCASHNSHFFCSVCSCYGIPTMYRTDFDHPDWQPRNVDVLRKAAYAWRDANTLQEREAIFQKYGVRWSEPWRLPYWNPGRMLVIDAMHCILEGTVHYHCRRVLEIDEKAASKSPKAAPAFDYTWPPYIADEVPEGFRVNSEKEYKQIASIRSFLATPLCGEAVTLSSKEQWVRKITGKNKPPLLFVCFSLGLRLPEKPTKADLGELLYEWVNFNVAES
jgi:cytochrome c5